MSQIMWRSVLVVVLVASRYAAGFPLPSRLSTDSDATQNAAVPVLPHERFVVYGHHRAARQTAFCGNFVCEFGETASTCPNDCTQPSCGTNGCEPNQGETAATCPTDCGSVGGTCNNNLVCEANLGETTTNCPNDCKAAVCGDGICQSTESAAFCPADCKCGNNVCDTAFGESMSTCPLDCKCGNGVCDTGVSETFATCPQDCTCGNGICETARLESNLNCPQDCPFSATSTSNFFPTTSFDPFAPTTSNPFFPTSTSSFFPTSGTTGGASQCNGDGYCDALAGESTTTCPSDCGGGGTSGAGTGSGTTPGTGSGTSPLQSCNNNGVCDPGETLAGCFNDCLTNGGEGNKLDNVKSYVESNPGAVLKKGEKLKAGKRLNASCDVYLELRMDGNIVIESESQGRIWESQSDGQCTRKCSLVLDTDGVLKLLLKISPGEYREKWSLSNKPSASAVLLPNGNFLTVDDSDTITYQTDQSIPVDNNICSEKTADNDTLSENKDGSSSASSATSSGSPSSTDTTASTTGAFSSSSTDFFAPSSTTDPFALPTTSTDSTFPTFSDSSSSTFSGFTDTVAALPPSDSGFSTTSSSTFAPAFPSTTSSSSAFFPAQTSSFTSTPIPSQSALAGYCGDGVCIPPERFENCPQDCPTTSGDVCGDGFCGLTENAGNCAGDCQAVCGDGFCGATENSTNCPVDCYCGNGICEADEANGVCVSDCPV